MAKPTMYLPVKVRYTLNSDRSIIIEGIRLNYPESQVFEFQIDDKPLSQHPIVKQHLADKGIDLTGAGRPTSGWIELTLGDNQVSFELNRFSTFLFI